MKTEVLKNAKIVWLLAIALLNIVKDLTFKNTQMYKFVIII
jgi:hypothetical protein